MNNPRLSFRRPCAGPIPRGLSVLLVALAWTSLALCGEIHDAARDGLLKKVKALLKQNPDLVFSKDDSHGAPPLNWAAFNGHQDVAELLLANKADLNARDSSGNTALHHAAQGNQKGMVNFLLSKGADINARSTDGFTPLYQAVLKGYKEVAELLLLKGADINAKGTQGATALHIAALNGNKQMVALLLANGAEVNARLSDGTTPLGCATSNGHAEVAELLRQHDGQGAVAAQSAPVPVPVASKVTTSVTAPNKGWWNCWPKLGRTEPTPLSVGFAIGDGIVITSMGPANPGATGHVTGRIVQASQESRIILMEVDDGSTVVGQIVEARLNHTSTGRPLLKFRVPSSPKLDWKLLKSGARLAFDCRELAGSLVEITNLAPQN